MIKKNTLENEKNTFKGRILECIGDKKPYTWGKSAGLDRGLLNRIFNDGKIPTWEPLVLISESLGKSINWLLTGTEHPLDKPNPNACLVHCNADEQHVVNKLVEIFRNDDETHKILVTHNINTLCGDKLWVRMGKPERRKKPDGRQGMPERRTRVFLYKN
ncbi:MAG: hypothetical protein D8M57_13035 [Candidatus Scalindua sp. AMX11]|nr:MAG: hypothetical protein DWQ00_12055 [Candidatus Scalindua sp.]NOG83803.1 hypothetical protein [Planctomycetota bacterium]RZV82959.1 MAG: hypothetical protein EX341_09210 [Candidatus Scalindua sp. SCAELEC01]TDE64419.1 MAG: hypothetical protein D8M57_13035 [Candidatus Scalindua sp. AMX11]GJQ59746.1 MAG: hypothetical protein SCALA701_25470 [Candidatus Scalindua sp.]